MTISMSMTTNAYQELRRHLLQDENEQAAFMFADMEATEDQLIFVVQEIHFMTAEKYTFQSSYHITLDDDVLGEMIRIAWQAGRVLVEVHSHRDDSSPVSFSGSDIRGFASVVPHVRWRMKGRPYAAIVMNETSLDALVWDGELDTARPLTRLEVGKDIVYPTNETLDYFESKYDK
jgi:hypothetical protein